MGMEFEDKSAEFLKRLEATADKAVGRASLVLEQSIQDTMPGVGAKVKDGTGGDTGKRGQYTPSNPGSPPGIRTNRLKGSIATQRTNKKMKWSVGDLEIPPPDPIAKVSGPVKYARMIEFGTSKMAARPFMAPGAEAAKKPMLKEFIKIMKSGLK